MTAPAAVAAVAPSPLRRLPGTSSLLRGRYGVRATLWLDDAQLLQESVRSYTQEVQRFALADLQAVQVRRTPRGLIYNLVLAVPVVAPLVFLVTTWNDPGTAFGDRVFLGCCAGFFAVLLLVNLLRGPTCRTTLTTALGPQILPSLSRLRAARRALDLVAANVAAVQGALRPDEAAAEVDRAQAQAPAAPAPTGAASQGYRP